MSGFASPRLVRPRAGATVRPLSAAAVAAAYEFPTASTTGLKFAMIELGGAHNEADYADYCQRAGFHTIPPIIVHEIGGAPQTADPGGADVEVALDVQVAASVLAAGAVEPGEIHLVFAPNTEQGYADAIVYAVEQIGAQIVGTSWGAPVSGPSGWTSGGIALVEAALAKAKAAKVTVLAAAGDAGKLDGTRKPVADYPAASTQVIACGGTELVLSGGKRFSETVWDDSASSATGGGVSPFARPAWQPASVGKYRAVPDIAGNAAPESGFPIVSGGKLIVVGGTSGLPPMFGAMLLVHTAMHNAPLPDVGPWCYANKGTLTDVTGGGGPDTYPATVDYDESTGLGVPNGAAMAAALGVVLPPPQPTPPVTPPSDPTQPTRARTPQEQAIAEWMTSAIASMMGWLATLPPA